MHNKKKIIRILLLIVAVILFISSFYFIIRWTNSIVKRKRAQELSIALKEVVDSKGEAGLLEMVGIPVNNIFYGDSGVTLFQGDQGSWNYSADELQNISIYEQCNQGVVYISTIIATSDASQDVIPENGTGSGIILNENGHILTNYHVIKDAYEIDVTLYNGNTYPAKIIGIDEENDIAVIKIETNSVETFTIIPFGNSDNLKIGQKVLAIGNPFGYERTQVTGNISGLSRPIRDDSGNLLLGMIQTDAPINPGNSGGPLLNSHGEIIGISTAIYSTADSGSGIGFAVPSNIALVSAKDLIKYGKVERGWLDIVPVQLSNQIVDYADMKISRGILVSQVVPNGKAEKAGLTGGNKKVRYGNSIIYLGGDVITKINGVDIEVYSDMYTALINSKPNQKVDIEVNRDGKIIKMKIELVERNSEILGWLVK